MTSYSTRTRARTRTQGEQGAEQRRDTGAVLLPGCGTPCPALHPLPHLCISLTALRNPLLRN